MAVQFVATVSTVPWRYSILGMIYSTRNALSGTEKVAECIADIKKRAESMGAKAIIGVQVSYGQETEKRAFQHMVTTVTGTAITWEDAPATQS